MLKISKGDFTLLLIIIIVISLIIGGMIGCVITPGSIVKTEIKEIEIPCEHPNLNDAGLLEQSITTHCEKCDIPAQKILYDSKNDITYIYTFFYSYREGYGHLLELKDINIFKIADGGITASY